ncbi:MAG: CehA/McbA family metallohydrolase [Nevskia sp.]
MASSLAPPSRAANIQDHFEFEAQLSAPYRAETSSRRDVDLQFRFPGALPGTVAVWRVDLVDPASRVLRSWHGQTHIDDGKASDRLSWFERDPQNGLLAAGIYQLRLRATTLDAGKLGIVSFGSLQQGIDAVLAAGAVEEQRWPIQIGEPARPSMPVFQRLPAASRASPASAVTTQSVPAPSPLPYTVYLGNLHSQTNHSDGGGALSSCTGAQNPQAGAFGPTDAYTYALGRGLDFLMTSEHNHLYDGSTGTNTSASPTTAHNLYQSGLSAATSFNSAHPNFLAIYGLEWGVINNGGHLNIFNTPELLEWEYNSLNQLIGDTLSPKGDYAALYTQMKNRGWIGQFNHPADTGQFVIGSTPLAYSADGDQVMVACEIMNSSAFSTNTTETETSLSSYESACNKLLEAGYHVAFTTDQDNHCANWGASYTNRNGVLIPNGTALSATSFLDALRARRMYATTDRTSQLVLTANGHIMGETFSNSGSLTLTANYAPGAGRSATQVQIFEGVPGSNGTVSVLATTATTTITPANGVHFYYAKITQDNGKLLWSAPVWVNQGAGAADTTPPTVSASESGSSGTITLSATASDNVGVTRVEFSIDGTLVATDSSAPYSVSFDSTTLANGSHSLVARAYDAANNVGTSSAVSFSISNTVTPPSQLILNGGFESGTANWTASAGVITNSASQAAHAGT